MPSLLTIIPTEGSSLQCSRANNSSTACPHARPSPRGSRGSVSRCPRTWTRSHQTEARTDPSATRASDRTIVPPRCWPPSPAPHTGTVGTGPLSSLEARSTASGCLVWPWDSVLNSQNLVSHTLEVGGRGQQIVGTLDVSFDTCLA